MESGREYRLDDPTPTVVQRWHSRLNHWFGPMRDEVETFIRKDHTVTTNPSVSRVRSNLLLFDGFPYLITRVVPGLYHIIVLPARQSIERYRELLRRQGESNRLQTCLVLDARTAWFWSLDGRLRQTSQPPTGGLIVTDRLLPGAAFDYTPDLSARHTRLERFTKARNPGGYSNGDLTKGGRPATPEERTRFGGNRSNGIPGGLERCLECGDWRGQCLDPSPNFAGVVMQVYCRCENDNRCARCGSLLAEHKLNANFYDASDGQIWHVPGFVGLSHRCPDRRSGSRRPLRPGVGT